MIKMDKYTKIIIGFLFLLPWIIPLFILLTLWDCIKTSWDFLIEEENY